MSVMKISSSLSHSMVILSLLKYLLEKGVGLYNLLTGRIFYHNFVITNGGILKLCGCIGTFSLRSTQCEVCECGFKTHLQA
jgi:hypothetical protein